MVQQLSEEEKGELIGPALTPEFASETLWCAQNAASVVPLGGATLMQTKETT